MSQRLTKEERRTIVLWFLENKSTVRGVAQRFGVSHGTAHRILRQAVELNGRKDVESLLQLNLEERTKRGGEATRRKYANAHR